MIEGFSGKNLMLLKDFCKSVSEALNSPAGGQGKHPPYLAHFADEKTEARGRLETPAQSHGCLSVKLYAQHSPPCPEVTSQ